MKKKAIALMLAMSMTAMFCACGTSEDSSVGTAREDSAFSAEDIETVTEEAGSEETEEETEGSEEVNEYGFTASQQEALIESVKNAVTTDFLEPNNISPSEFVLQPYDVNDLYNYDSDGNYTGDDPYETSSAWVFMDRLVFLESNVYLYISEVDSLGFDFIADTIAGALDDGIINIATTVEDTNYVLYGSKEKVALESAIYKGIASFLNSLDSRECAELLINLGIRSEYISNLGSETPQSTTVFDKVITENIQFE